jgi:uncharacterized protein with HEPN domain
MLQDDIVRLKHMLDAVKEALEFTKGKTRVNLDDNRMLSHAIIRLLEIIGEAAVELSDEFQKAHSELPTKQMIGMRNRLIHGYFDVDLDIVWQTIKKDLPSLRNQLEEILENK